MFLRLWHIWHVAQLYIKNQNRDSGSEILSLSQIVRRFYLLLGRPLSSGALMDTVFLWVIMCFWTKVTVSHLLAPPPSAMVEYAVSITHCFIRLYYGLLRLDHLQPLQDLSFQLPLTAFLFVCNRFPAWLEWRHPPDSYFKFGTQKHNLLLSYFSHFSILEVLYKFKRGVENKPGTYKNRNRR